MRYEPEQVMVGAGITEENLIVLTFTYEEEVVAITVDDDGLLRLSKMLKDYHEKIKEMGPNVGTGLAEEVM